MVALPGGVKSLKMCLLVLMQYTDVTDGWTDVTNGWTDGHVGQMHHSAERVSAIVINV